MKYAISGSSGFLGTKLRERLGEVLQLKRDGYITSNSDVIFDLATYGNMSHHLIDAKAIYRANLMRVINIINTMKPETKLIYLSTSSVLLPYQTFYSASKKAAEEMLKVAQHESRLKVAIVRPYSITGVGEQKEHLIPKLIDSCLKGTKMPLVMEPVHDFIDVHDVVNALLTITSQGQFEGEVYEVGSGEQLPNDTVRQLVESVTGKRANLDVVDSMRAYDTKDWKANNERISTLGWEPKKSLRQTIEEMVLDYETR